jgi:hypothetical protein
MEPWSYENEPNEPLWTVLRIYAYIPVTIVTRLWAGQLGNQGLFLGRDRLADHSPPSSAEIKTVGLYLHSTMSLWCGA